MPRIIPIKELKNTSKMSDMCHESPSPIYITKNGFGDMVLMSMEAYEELHRKEEIYRDLELSEQQFKDGNKKDAKQSLKELRNKYGL